MIVVDANVVAYTFIEGEKTELTRALREHDPDWRVPRIWREEFANVLALHVRIGRLKKEQARDMFRDALGVVLPAESETDPAAALELAIDLHLSGYDAQYLALARQLGVTLITEDTRLRKAAPEQTMSMAQACGRSGGRA
ncbi:MAG: type II toxin-antitoxin system VapC family toxin [bacterium]